MHTTDLPVRFIPLYQLGKGRVVAESYLSTVPEKDDPHPASPSPSPRPVTPRPREKETLGSPDAATPPLPTAPNPGYQEPGKPTPPPYAPPSNFHPPEASPNTLYPPPPSNITPRSFYPPLFHDTSRSLYPSLYTATPPADSGSPCLSTSEPEPPALYLSLSPFRPHPTPSHPSPTKPAPTPSPRGAPPHIPERSLTCPWKGPSRGTHDHYCDVYDCGPRPKVEMKQPEPNAIQAPAIVVGDARAFVPLAVTWATPEGPARVSIEGPSPGPQPAPRTKNPVNPEEGTNSWESMEKEEVKEEKEETMYPLTGEGGPGKWKKGCHQSRKGQPYDIGLRDLPGNPHNLPGEPYHPDTPRPLRKTLSLPRAGGARGFQPIQGASSRFWTPPGENTRYSVEGGRQLSSDEDCLRKAWEAVAREEEELAAEGAIQMPLLESATRIGGRYQPWSHRDMSALVDQLPPP
ncbi:hypothetical protein N1851_028710 [Merluccius polli]|uniref:Uncharacterized protein n=1 Tax=Merluccius polli TaxID=89951 RepID=A0AA47M873_MERPO|nr:hypothetical protein N1851_028710 [Merluccius polli]